jgi:tRNA (cytidine/uridine-2'-O-)-methyltransferase
LLRLVRRVHDAIPLSPIPQRIGAGDGFEPHIVLLEPLIPQNTGNIARLCAAVGAWLHLVEPLGFDLDHGKLKRAGLDYWPAVKLSLHENLESVTSRTDASNMAFFSKHAERLYTEVSYGPSPVLVFGKETAGLGEDIRARFAAQLVRIPTTGDVRSLNLSNAASIAVYEVVRQQAWRGMLPSE